MIAEARQALLLQRVLGGSAALGARQALEMTTRGGPQVLGRPDIGALAPDMAADFVAFRLDELSLAGGGLHDPVAALVFKPYANLTVDPDQNLYDIPVPNPRLHYGLAVGAQLFIGFNDALGLPFFNPR